MRIARFRYFRQEFDVHVKQRQCLSRERQKIAGLRRIVSEFGPKDDPRAIQFASPY